MYVQEQLQELIAFFPTILVTFIVTLSTIIVAILSTNRTLSKIQHKETHEIKSDVESVVKKIRGSENVIDLMMKNLAELREYYVISKQQARKSFMAALIICILGFVIFALGIISSYFGNQNVVSFTTISGSIVEVISGLFFFMYKSSLKQLNIYHERLGTTEKYLIAMQLIEKTSDDKKDENYRYLMESILIDNSSVVRNKKDDTAK